MTINFMQRLVLLMAAGIIAVMTVYPPWIYTVDIEDASGKVFYEKPAGYAYIYEAPSPEFDEYGVRLDATMLGFQWLGASLMSLALVLAFGPGKPKVKKVTRKKKAPADKTSGEAKLKKVELPTDTDQAATG